MFHVAAFASAIDNTANTTLAAVADQILSIDSNQLFAQQDMTLQAIYAAAATIQRARLSSPKLRQVAVPYIVPIDPGATPSDDPNVMDMRDHPVILRGLERFQPEFTSGVAMGTERAWCVLFLTPGYVPPPSGETITLRATGTTTLVQAVWTDVTLTWDQQLARGRYAIIGGQLQSATAIAWRLILENQYWRPGALGITALTRRSHRMFYDGGMGSWGEFFSTGLPRLQVMSNAGDTAENLFLQCVRIGP